MQNTHPISLSHVDFSWPDGTPVFSDLNANFSAGRTGLVGPNGTGKTVLLRLIAGQLKASAGDVTVASSLAYLPQKLTLDTAATISDVLGLTAKRQALAAVLNGQEADMAANFEVIGDDWDIEERAVAQLASFGLPADSVDFLDRTIGTVSGGEAMIAALAGLEMANNAITLLDEPSNNLDSTARKGLYEAVERWRGTLLVVSHDVALLERVENIAELRQVRSSQWEGERVKLRWHGGDWLSFQAELAAEKEQTARLIRDASARLANEKRQRIEAETKLARRAKQGRKAAAGLPKILVNARKNSAENTASKVRGLMGDREAAAANALTEAKDAVIKDKRIHIDLPETAVPAGRVILEVTASVATRGRLFSGGAQLEPEDSLIVKGPQRVVLTGPNGVGKTTLLNALAESAKVPVGYLRQRLGSTSQPEHGAESQITDDAGWQGLSENATVLDNIASAASGIPIPQIRQELAKFELRGDAANQLVSELSGGERFRVALAKILLSRPAPQLLILDEPSNNLDLDSVEQLLSALSSYQGALLLTSHDAKFVERLAPETVWELRR